MSKIFYVILAIIVSISVFILFSFCKQNSTIIESHQGHGGRGHPHGSGSRHRYGYGGGGYGYGGGGGWWRRQYAQPIYYGYDGVNVNYNCRNGCINTGNGWGCQYPGWRATDCWFASDCDGCGGGRPGGWWFY